MKEDDFLPVSRNVAEVSEVLMMALLQIFPIICINVRNNKNPRASKDAGIDPNY
jgi:hypothetical protein